MQRYWQAGRGPVPKAEADAIVKVELATSSYRQFEPGMGVPVRITLGKPRFRLPYEYEEIRVLAPTPKIFRLRGKEFEHEYREHLERIGVKRLKTIFGQMAGRHDDTRLVLLSSRTCWRARAATAGRSAVGGRSKPGRRYRS
jgi:hypothetical protein